MLPLQFADGQSAESLGLTGAETYAITGLAGREATEPMPTEVTVQATNEAGDTVELTATVRIDTPKEADYYRHGGILQFVARHLAQP